VHLKKIASILREAASDFDSHNATRFSAALAFYTILSLAPLVILATFVAGRILGSSATENGVFHQLRQIIGGTGADAMRMALEPDGQTSTAVVSSGLGLLTSLFGASGVFVELRAALNAVWDIAPEQGNGFVVLIRERLFSFVMVVAVGFLLLFSLLASAALSLVGRFVAGALPLPEGLLTVTDAGVSFVATSVLFVLIFKYVPDGRILWGDIVPGAMITAFFFDLGKLLLGLYLKTMAVGSAYGAAGSVVVITVWVYYSSMIFLYGAEFTHAWARQSGPGRQPGYPV
jgi:membrane protein